MQQFVSGVNCHPAAAREGNAGGQAPVCKEDGKVAYHGYQSLPPAKRPEMARMEIGVKLAAALWGEKYAGHCGHTPG